MADDAPKPQGDGSPGSTMPMNSYRITDAASGRVESEGPVYKGKLYHVHADQPPQSLSPVNVVGRDYEPQYDDPNYVGEHAAEQVARRNMYMKGKKVDPYGMVAGDEDEKPKKTAPKVKGRTKPKRK